MRVWGRRMRALGALVALASASLVSVVAFSGTAGAVVVNSEGSFKSAYANSTINEIVLLNDITFTCAGGGPAVRVASPSDVTIEGNGQTLTQSCANNPTLIHLGPGDLTVNDLTMTGGSLAVQAISDLTFNGSTITDLSGPVAEGVVVIGRLTLNDTTISDVIGTVAGIGVLGILDMTMTNSAVTNVRGATAQGIQSLGVLTMEGSTLDTVVGTGTSLGVFGITSNITDSEITGVRATGGAALSVINVGTQLVLDGTTVSGTSGSFAATAVQSVGTGGARIVDSAILDTAGGSVLTTQALLAFGRLSLERSTIARTAGIPLLGISATPGTGVSIVNSTITSNESGMELITGGSDGASIVYSTITHNGPGGVAIASTIDVPEVYVPPVLQKLEDEGKVDLSPLKAVHDIDISAVSGGVRPQAITSQVLSAAGDFNAFGTVIAQPEGGAVNCQITAGFTLTSSYNFSDDASCGFTGTGDQENAGDPELGDLTDNGGPTPTRLPLGLPTDPASERSPLLDAIPVSACENDGASGITTDQRSLPRPAPEFEGCDIGAVEVQPPPPPPPIVPAVVVQPTFTG